MSDLHNDANRPVGVLEEREFNESLFGSLFGDLDAVAHIDLQDNPASQQATIAKEMHDTFRADLTSPILSSLTSEITTASCEFQNFDDSTLDEDGLISDMTTQIAHELNYIKGSTETSVNVSLPSSEDSIGDLGSSFVMIKNKACVTQIKTTQATKFDDARTLNRNLNNRQTVFQAMYYYHCSIGGNTETTFKMKDVANMFPEIVCIMRSGHGLIPGALAKRGLVKHVEKGKGTYRLTENGIAAALAYGW